MHSKADDIRVDFVPHGDLVGAIPLVYPHLLEGAKVSKQDVGELLIGVCAGKSQLWMISDARELKVLGAVLTDIHTEARGPKFVLMHSLAGAGAWRWFRQLHRAIYNFALSNDCRAVRFYGRKAWGHYFKDCRFTGAKREGHWLFERAVP